MKNSDFIEQKVQGKEARAEVLKALKNIHKEEDFRIVTDSCKISEFQIFEGNVIGRGNVFAMNNSSELQKLADNLGY